MDSIFASTCGIVLLLVLIVVLYKAIKSSTRVVPQEQRLVIYRLGKFNRISGPGPVRVIPKLEQVVRTFEVRDHPIEVVVEGIFAFGVPNNLTLNLWGSFDLEEAAGGDRLKLAQFVQVTTAERRRQVEVKMREALIGQVAKLQKEMPLKEGATTFDGIIALAPGSERYNALLAGVKHQLEQTLPTVGVILDIGQPIIITNRGLSSDIIEALQQKRSVDISGETLITYATKLKKDFPDISNAVVAQILGSIPGVDLGNLQRLLWEQGEYSKAESAKREVEMEIPVDGGNVIIKPHDTDDDTVSQSQAKSSRTKSETETPTQEPRRLAKNDLSVLKRVPRRNNRDQRMSA